MKIFLRLLSLASILKPSLATIESEIGRAEFLQQVPSSHFTTNTLVIENQPDTTPGLESAEPRCEDEDNDYRETHPRSMPHRVNTQPLDAIQRTESVIARMDLLECRRLCLDKLSLQETSANEPLSIDSNDSSTGNKSNRDLVAFALPDIGPRRLGQHSQVQDAHESAGYYTKCLTQSCRKRKRQSSTEAQEMSEPKMARETVSKTEESKDRMQDIDGGGTNTYKQPNVTYWSEEERKRNGRFAVAFFIRVADLISTKKMIFEDALKSVKESTSRRTIGAQSKEDFTIIEVSHVDSQLSARSIFIVLSAMFKWMLSIDDGGFSGISEPLSCIQTVNEQLMKITDWIDIIRDCLLYTSINKCDLFQKSLCVIGYGDFKRINNRHEVLFRSKMRLCAYWTGSRAKNSLRGAHTVPRLKDSWIFGNTDFNLYEPTLSTLLSHTIIGWKRPFWIVLIELLGPLNLEKVCLKAGDTSKSTPLHIRWDEYMGKYVCSIKSCTSWSNTRKRSFFWFLYFLDIRVIEYHSYVSNDRKHYRKKIMTEGEDESDPYFDRESLRYTDFSVDMSKISKDIARVLPSQVTPPEDYKITVYRGAYLTYGDLARSIIRLSVEEPESAVKGSRNEVRVNHMMGCEELNEVTKHDETSKGMLERDERKAPDASKKVLKLRSSIRTLLHNSRLRWVGFRAKRTCCFDCVIDFHREVLEQLMKQAEVTLFQEARADNTWDTLFLYDLTCTTGQGTYILKETALRLRTELETMARERRKNDSSFGAIEISVSYKYRSHGMREFSFKSEVLSPALYREPQVLFKIKKFSVLSSEVKEHRKICKNILSLRIETLEISAFMLCSLSKVVEKGDEHPLFSELGQIHVYMEEFESLSHDFCDFPTIRMLEVPEKIGTLDWKLVSLIWKYRCDKNLDFRVFIHNQFVEVYEAVF